MGSPNDLPEPDGVPSTAPRWRFKLIVALLCVVGAAVAARAMRGTPEARAEEAAEKRSAQPGGGLTSSLVSGEHGTTPETAPPPEEKDTLDTVLPYVTDGGIWMIFGLLLGMVTRSFLKLLFVLTILGFATVQYLAYKGVLTVNWGAMKDFVLNMVPKGASMSEIVQKKLPSLGAFGLGYLLGLKRG
jgi:uncharacterized membrane protein (Fun14 family)